MIAEFSIVPLDKGPHLGKEVASILDIVDRSGLPYELTPMGTIVEGSWDEIIGLIRRCHEKEREGSGRVLTTIHIDDKEGEEGLIRSKVASVESHLGRKLKKVSGP